MNFKEKQLNACLKIQSVIRRFYVSKWYQHIYNQIIVLQSFNRIILAKNKLIDAKKYKKSLKGTKEKVVKLELEKNKLEQQSKNLDHLNQQLEQETKELSQQNFLLEKEMNYLDKENKSLNE